MAQIGLPRGDMYAGTLGVDPNPYAWYPIEIIEGIVNPTFGPLWPMVDDYPNVDNGITYIQTLTIDQIDFFDSTIGFVPVALAFQMRRSAGGPLINPRNYNNHIVHLTVAKANSSSAVTIDQISLLSGLGKALSSPLSRVDTFLSHSRTPVFTQSRAITAVFPEFETFQFTISEGTARSAVLNYSDLTVDTRFNVFPDQDKEQAVYVSRVMFSTPSPAFAGEERSLSGFDGTNGLDDDRNLMKAMAQNILMRTQDERIVWDFECARADETPLGLLNKVASTSLNRWSDVDLQVMSGSVDFKKNTIRVRATNDIHREIAYRELMRRTDNLEKRAKLGLLERKVKNRRQQFKRSRPYEDKMTTEMGGQKTRSGYFEDMEVDGEKVMEAPNREPIKPIGLGSR